MKLEKSFCWMQICFKVPFFQLKQATFHTHNAKRKIFSFEQVNSSIPFVSWWFEHSFVILCFQKQRGPLEVCLCYLPRILRFPGTIYSSSHAQNASLSKCIIMYAKLFMASDMKRHFRALSYRGAKLWGRETKLEPLEHLQRLTIDGGAILIPFVCSFS